MAGVVVVHQRVRAELLAVWATRVRNMKNERARFAVLPIELNHTFNFKDLYLVNKNTNQLRKVSVFCWDADDQPIFLWNVLTNVNKQKFLKSFFDFSWNLITNVSYFFQLLLLGAAAPADHAALRVRDGTVRKTALEGGRRRPLLELLASSSYSSLFVWTIRMANFALDCFRQIFRNK